MPFAVRRTGHTGSQARATDAVAATPPVVPGVLGSLPVATGLVAPRRPRGAAIPTAPVLAAAAPVVRRLVGVQEEVPPATRLVVGPVARPYATAVQEEGGLARGRPCPVLRQTRPVGVPPRTQRPYRVPRPSGATAPGLSGPDIREVDRHEVVFRTGTLVPVTKTGVRDVVGGPQARPVVAVDTRVGQVGVVADVPVQGPRARRGQDGTGRPAPNTQAVTVPRVGEKMVVVGVDLRTGGVGQVGRVAALVVVVPVVATVRPGTPLVALGVGRPAVLVLGRVVVVEAEPEAVRPVARPQVPLLAVPRRRPTLLVVGARDPLVVLVVGLFRAKDGHNAVVRPRDPAGAAVGEEAAAAPPAPRPGVARRGVGDDIVVPTGLLGQEAPPARRDAGPVVGLLSGGRGAVLRRPPMAVPAPAPTALRLPYDAVGTRDAAHLAGLRPGRLPGLLRVVVSGVDVAAPRLGGRLPETDVYAPLVPRLGRVPGPATARKASVPVAVGRPTGLTGRGGRQVDEVRRQACPVVGRVATVGTLPPVEVVADTPTGAVGRPPVRALDVPRVPRLGVGLVVARRVLVRVLARAEVLAVPQVVNDILVVGPFSVAGA